MVTGLAVLGRTPVVPALAAIDTMRIGLVKWRFKISDKLHGDP